MKIAALFPGQGSQHVGMGKDFADSPFFNIANTILGIDLRKICLEGPEEILKKTELTQPAILTISVILYKKLRHLGINFDLLAGHSLGEYSALFAAGSITFHDAISLVHSRGQFMQEAVPCGEGAMAAILGFDKSKLEQICAYSGCDLANYNSPEQIVISGKKDSIEKTIEICKSEGAKKIVILPVSAPFHSKLMAPAAEKLAYELKNIEINDAKIPIISNVTADIVTSRGIIHKLLVEQVTSPVNWTDSINTMLNFNIDTFVEIGPGKVLTGLVKKIIPRNVKYSIYNVSDQLSLELFLESIKTLQCV